MRKLFLCAALLMFVFVSLAHSSETINHYEADAVNSQEDALKALDKNSEIISAILQKDNLDAAHLEDIHRVSYTLENAIDKLISEKAAPETVLNPVEKAIQNIHDSSEDHEEQAVRQHFQDFQSSFKALKSVI
ncbi:MAG: DUF6746 family protein [Pseudomonadota bacterium]